MILDFSLVIVGIILSALLIYVDWLIYKFWIVHTKLTLILAILIVAFICLATWEVLLGNYFWGL